MQFELTLELQRFRVSVSPPLEGLGGPCCVSCRGSTAWVRVCAPGVVVSHGLVVSAGGRAHSGPSASGVRALATISRRGAALPARGPRRACGNQA